MRLSAFIHANLDAIVADWETFARTLPAGQSMTALALRDHSREILVAIAFCTAAFLWVFRKPLDFGAFVVPGWEASKRWIASVPVGENDASSRKPLLTCGFIGTLRSTQVLPPSSER